MTAEASGLVVFGSSQSRSLAGTPWALSAPHMTGSHDTTAVVLTCWATQAAARLRVAASALRTLALAVLRAGEGAFAPWLDRAITSAPAPAPARRASAPPGLGHRRPTVGRRLTGWLSGHTSCTGSAARPNCPARSCVAGSTEYAGGAG